MKPSARWIAIIVVAALVGTAIAHYVDFLPYRWQKFTGPDGTFSVAFPAKPQFEDQQVQLNPGGTVVVRVVSATPDKNSWYSFAYYEDSQLGSGSVEEILNGARDGCISEVQGILVGEDHVNVGGRPARDVEVRARDGSLVSVRLILVGRRLFILVVAKVAQRADFENVQKFFDSLKFAELHAIAADFPTFV